MIIKLTHKPKRRVCHPEHSEGSNVKIRFFATLRMTLLRKVNNRLRFYLNLIFSIFYIIMNKNTRGYAKWLV